MYQTAPPTSTASTPRDSILLREIRAMPTLVGVPAGNLTRAA
jgi:hypothetical protein